jgi:hypothetical protein
MSTCGCCSDSALSTTGNIVGILTFALGLAASYVVYGALTRGALDEIDSFSRDLDRIKTQVIPFLRFCENENRNSNSDFKVYEQGLEQSLRSLLGSIDGLLRDLQALHRLNTRSSNPFDFQARRRFVWVFKRQNFMEKMARISSHRAEMLGVQMSLLLRCVSFWASDVSLSASLLKPLFSKVTSQERHNTVQMEILQHIMTKIDSPAPSA